MTHPAHDIAYPGVLERAGLVVRLALRTLLPPPVGLDDEDAALGDAVLAINAEPTPSTLRADLLVALPGLRHAVGLDVNAAHIGDPACRHPDEAAMCYPGVHAIAAHRLAHWLWLRAMPTAARLIAEHAHTLTSIDIHPGASIGGSFFIDHGTGVVIGETSVIGEHVKLYQGVTLGAISTDRARVGTAKRHPTLEDHVTVYANATILGGDTIIGAGSVIGAGVQLTSSVPPRHVVLNPKPTVELRPHRGDIPPSYAI